MKADGSIIVKKAEGCMRTDRIYLTSTLVAMALLTIILSCGGNTKTFVAYEGPRRTVDEVAIITGASSGTIIRGVDSLVKKRPFSIGERHIEILPGMHSVTVDYYRVTIARRKSSRTSVILEFEALAGHTYGVESEGGYRRWQAWIIDMADTSMVTQKREGFLR